ncbi:MAG: hypothetical protein MUE40_02760 [Anaerolineae bacterium]|nr:hypothetical protein [Anaerolineae bacterium]
MEAVLNLLRPESLAHIFLYVLFFLGLVLLFVIPEKNETPQYLVFAMLFMVIVAFLRTRAAPGSFPVPGSENNGFFTFLLHIAIAIAPLLAGTMARKQGRKGGAAIPVGILTAFVGGVFALLSFTFIPMMYGRM